MRTLFLTSFHSFISKNVLNTGVLTALKATPDLRVVLLVPKEKAAFFERHYGGGNVVVEGVDVAVVTSSPRDVLFRRLFFLMVDSHYLWYKRVERRDADPTAWAWVKYWAYGAAAKVLSGSRLLNRLVRFLYRRLAPTDLLKAHFERYAPTHLFSTDVFDPMDVLFLKEARSRGVKTIGMVRSWDNCWSKGLMPVIPDRLLTNNRIIKEEAVALHDVPADRVAAVGLPQFDAFVNEPRTPREAFFRSIGVDSAKRLIVFAPAGSILSDTDWQVCGILAEGLERGRIRPDVHVFVRNHPHHPADLSRFTGNPSFTIQNPGQAFDANAKNAELAPDEQRFLADLLFHADLVLWIATTLGLDAAVYDKPQIMISFDGTERKVYTRSVARYHDEDHMRKLIATGGVRVARTAEGLYDAIGAYLADPSLDREGRRRIVEEQLERLDGRSAERVAGELKDFLR